MGSSSYNNYYHEIDSSFDSSNNRLFCVLWSGYYVRIHCLVLELKILLYKSLEMTFSNVAKGINQSIFLELQWKVIFILSVFYKRVVNTKDLQWGKRILRNKKAALLYGETVPQTAERHFESFGCQSYHRMLELILDTEKYKTKFSKYSISDSLE